MSQNYKLIINLYKSHALSKKSRMLFNMILQHPRSSQTKKGGLGSEEVEEEEIDFGAGMDTFGGDEGGGNY